MEKVGRTSVLSHYGMRTLLYGTLLPGPDIGRRCAAILREVRDEGFEVGIHTWDHVKWQDGVAQRGRALDATADGARRERFREVFGEDAEGARRRRLADERARLPHAAAARLPLRLGWPRPLIPSCR